MVTTTLRGRLVLALGAMLCIVFALAALQVWGARQAESYFNRGQFAHTQLEAYMAISLWAYRYSKAIADVLAFGSPMDLDDLTQLQTELYANINKIQSITKSEIQWAVDRRDKESQIRESERVGQIRAGIDRVARTVAEVKRMQQSGLDPAAWQLDAWLREWGMGEAFKRLIDEAIAEERDEVRAFEERGERLAHRLTALASITAILSIGLALTIGIILFRGIKKPIEELMVGTVKLARGEFDHRIAVARPDELARLAQSFNAMSAELAAQRAALLEARSALESAVRERTRELHEANQELQRIDKARRQFFADISHELRTPLTVIRGEAEVTLRGSDKAEIEYRDALRRIVELTGQMGHLVDDLLLLARSGSVTRAEIGTHPLDDVLADTCEHGRALARQKQIDIMLALSDRPVMVRGERQRLRQLFLILLDNAYRYTPPGGDITVLLEKDGGDALVTISDTGVGIRAEDGERLFERGFRSKEARALAPDGLGLGLAVARAIVHAHRGEIAVVGAPLRGATVTVRLPLTAV
ncbi:MAG: ATP-binding protein [Gammaproteobacteria bacterium]